MKLTEKGKQAFELACKHYRNESFSAADLSAASGIKIAAASLTALEKKWLLEKGRKNLQQTNNQNKQKSTKINHFYRLKHVFRCLRLIHHLRCRKCI